MVRIVIGAQFDLYGNLKLNTDKIMADRGGTVVKVLRYKSEGRGFDPSWCHWNLSLM